VARIADRAPSPRRRLAAAFAFIKLHGNHQPTVFRLTVTILISALIQVTNLGTGILLARGLGPTGRGILTAALLYGPLFAYIGGLGVAEAVVYRSGRAGKSKSPALVTALCVAAFQSVILVLLGWIAVPALLRGSSHPALSGALAYLAIIPLVFLSQYPLAVLQGRLRIAKFNFIRLMVQLIYAAALLLLWRTGMMRVPLVLWASLLSAAMACIVALAWAAPFSTGTASFGEARELLRYGLRTQAGNLASILVAWLDLLVLAAVVSPRDLGVYAVATSAATTASIIPAAASLVLFPTFANRSPEAAPRALARFLTWGLSGALLLGPLLLLLVPLAIRPVYGSAFSAAIPLCIVLIPAYLLRGSNQMLVAILQGSGAPLRSSFGQIVGLAVLCIGLPVGISLAGTKGAAVAVTVSASAAFACLLVSACLHAKLSLHGILATWESDMSRLKMILKSRSADATGTGS
jgi:O-antigen/teichoic acid export membrane protein